MHVELTPEARRQLSRLPRKVYEVVAAVIDAPITENPYRVSKALHDELAAYRSVRRGDYRVLLMINDEREVVTIVRVEHRSGIYRPRGPGTRSRETSSVPRDRSARHPRGRRRPGAETTEAEEPTAG